MKKLKNGKIGDFCFSGATEYTESDEIWHLGVDYGSILTCQIQPGLIEGCGYMSPKKIQNRSYLRGYVWLYMSISRSQQNVA